MSFSERKHVLTFALDDGREIQPGDLISLRVREGDDFEGVVSVVSNAFALTVDEATRVVSQTMTITLTGLPGVSIEDVAKARRELIEMQKDLAD